jgi:hypothetical protein
VSVTNAPLIHAKSMHFLTRISLNALLILTQAGADPKSKTIGRGGETPMQVAKDARAYAVIAVLEKYIK